MCRAAALLLFIACGHAQEPDPAPPAAPVAGSTAAAPVVTADAGIVPPGDAAASIKAAGTLTSYRAAIAAFRTAWDTGVTASLATSQWSSSVAGLTDLVHAKELAAAKVKCRDQHARIVDVIGPGATTNVLFGSLPALARNGDCWLVHTSISAFTELWGYLDASTGELIVIWHTIEG